MALLNYMRLKRHERGEAMLDAHFFRILVKFYVEIVVNCPINVYVIYSDLSKIFLKKNVSNILA